MAQFVITNGYLTVNAVDLSDHVKSMVLNYAAEAIDDTAMGDTSRSRLGGLKDFSLDVTFQQDFAATKTDATLFSLVGTTTAIAVRAVNGAIAATNPEYQATMFLESYQPIQGRTGEEALLQARFLSAGGALTRDTTP